MMVVMSLVRPTNSLEFYLKICRYHGKRNMWRSSEMLTIYCVNGESGQVTRDYLL